MAYVDIGDVTDGGTIETTWGDQVRANFQAGVPDIFTTKGDLAGATGADAAARLPIGADDSTLVPDSGEATGMIWQTQPACHITNSGAILMDQEVWTSIEFDTETQDTDAMHNPASNPSRINIPANGGGFFMIGFNGNASRASANTSAWSARIMIDGATEIAHIKSPGGKPAYINISIGYVVAAASYIEIQYYSGSVADQSIAIGGSFWCIWQRRQ